MLAALTGAPQTRADIARTVDRDPKDRSVGRALAALAAEGRATRDGSETRPLWKLAGARPAVRLAMSAEAPPFASDAQVTATPPGPGAGDPPEHPTPAAERPDARSHVIHPATPAEEEEYQRLVAKWSPGPFPAERPADAPARAVGRAAVRLAAPAEQTELDPLPAWADPDPAAA